MFKEMFKDFFKDRTKVLFSLFVITSVILPITYSRYIVQNAGSATSALAKWQVSAEGNSNNELQLVSKNVSQTSYTFEVTSLSEVACDYSIILTNVPNDVSLKVDNKSTVYTPVSGSIIVENVGGFDAGDEDDTHNHTLTFITDTTTASVLDLEVNLEVDIKQRLSTEGV